MNAMDNWRDIEPQQLLDGLAQGTVEPRQIIDVREAEEWEYYHLPETLHMPMNSVPARLAELSADREWFVMCAHGVRSRYVSHYLHEQGYGRIRNVSGGISAVARLRGFRYD